MRGGRSGHAFVSERAGLKALRHSGQAPDAGARGLPGIPGIREGRLRALREVRYAGAAAHVHQGIPQPVHSGDFAACGPGKEDLREELPEIRHDARLREEKAPHGGGPHGRAGRTCGELSVQPHRVGRAGQRHHHLRNILSVR